MGAVSDVTCTQRTAPVERHYCLASGKYIHERASNSVTCRSNCRLSGIKANDTLVRLTSLPAVFGPEQQF